MKHLQRGVSTIALVLVLILVLLLLGGFPFAAPFYGVQGAVVVALVVVVVLALVGKL